MTHDTKMDINIVLIVPAVWDLLTCSVCRDQLCLSVVSPPPPGLVSAAQWIERFLSVPVCIILEAHPLHGRQLLAEMASHASHCHHP